MNDFAVGSQDRLVRTHIKAVSDFCAALFPHDLSDECVDEVFGRAEADMPLDPHPDERWVLFRYVIEAMTTRHPEPSWWERNSEAIAGRLGGATTTSTNSALKTQSKSLVDAYARLSIIDQFVVSLMTIAQDLPDAAHPIILGVSEHAADRLRCRARSRLEAELSRVS